MMFPSSTEHNTGSRLLNYVLSLPFHRSSFFLSEQLSSQMESVSIKQESDMRQLDFRVRISLAILLDQNESWRQLCRLMNLNSLESGFATFSSPTKEVLAMYEVNPIPNLHSIHVYNV